jgi:hypothetical protein
MAAVVWAFSFGQPGPRSVVEGAFVVTPPPSTCRRVPRGRQLRPALPVPDDEPDGKDQQQQQQQQQHTRQEQLAYLLAEQARLDARLPDDAAATEFPTGPLPSSSATTTTVLPDEDEEGGIFLDPENYARAREFLGPDGSLRLDSPLDDAGRSNAAGEGTSINQTNDDGSRRRKVLHNYLESFASSPSATTTSSLSPATPGGDAGASLNDLLEALRKQPTMTTDKANNSSEELHRQVLAKEEGFLRSSEIFRASLLDASKSLEAAEFRTGEAFRQRQTRAREALDAQLAEFATTLAQQPTPLHPCQSCGTELTAAERAHAVKSLAKQTGGQSAAPHICRVCLSEQIARETRAATRTSTFSPAPPPLVRRSPSYPSSRRSTNHTASGRATNVHRSPARPPRVDNTPRIRKLMDDPTSDRLQEAPSSVPSLLVPETEKETEEEEWEKIEDPDTGEIFYWNAHTDEMKWEE